MKILPLLLGGLVAGSLIVLGELPLNLWLLGDDWTALMTRFGLPEPGPLEAVQGLLKLLVLGVGGVWLSTRLRTAIPPGLLAGLVVWGLVWAWVQWGLLLAGFVTPRIAALTTIWGLIEVPLAIWTGCRAHRWLEARSTAGGVALGDV